MRKNKALALALAAAMTASMTPITAMADETEGLTSYYTYQTAVNEMETFCVQNAQNAKELQVLTNTTYCFIVYAFDEPKFCLLTSSCTLHSRQFPR